MKKLFLIFIFLICFVLNANAKQVLPDFLVRNTLTISAPKTGELGKNFFYCANGKKCSTEQVVREYYKNNGYKVMRAEYSFWKAMFVLTFLDELYPQTLVLKTENKFLDRPLDNISNENIQIKNKLISTTNLQKFINNQIEKHKRGSYIRWLDEWEIEGYKNPTEYFKSPIVQEFLTKIGNGIFCKVIMHILTLDDKNPIGTPDYIIWNKEEMIFIEVKRKNEKLSPEQIEWGEFLIKNKIPYKIVRVVYPN